MNESLSSNNKIFFQEKWKNLLSECSNIGLPVEDDLKEKQPSTEQEFKDLERMIEEKYFCAALSIEKEILPSSIEPEAFLNKIKREKGRSSKDIYTISRSKHKLMKLGFRFETYLGAGGEFLFSFEK